jgi:flagellar biosynthetic protein FlhB
MAENQDGQEKTEDASGKKLEDAKKEGSVPKSQEINTTAVFFGALIILLFYGNTVREELSNFMIYTFSNIDKMTINYLFVTQKIWSMTFFIIKIIGPIMLVIAIFGTIGNIAQTGFFIAPKALEPKFSKLNPISGFKKIIFTKKSLVELLKSILKFVIVGYVAYSTVMDYVDEFPLLIYQTTSQLLEYIFEIVLAIAIKIIMIYVVISALDFWFQKYDFMEEQKMTKQEVKDESKSMEGSPEIKAKIKSMQRAMAQNRMMQDIPDADVVITNPTHYAVALKYDSSSMAAPKIVAKGVDRIAERIKTIAKENDVPIIENVELARALYASADVGDDVPEDLYQAVAEVLAFVYKLKNKK